MVCESLKKIQSALTPQLWTTFFDAGSLTFEALEDMLRECCAAVFVIRRDDIVHHVHRGDAPTAKENRPPAEEKAAYMPRGNVLIEFGLVAGRLGRRRLIKPIYISVIPLTTLSVRPMADSN